MKKTFFLLVLIPAFYTCSGPDKKSRTGHPSDSASVKDSGISQKDSGVGLQDGGWVQDPDQADIIPPFGLEQIQKIVAGLKSVDDSSGDGSVTALDDTTYAALSLDEKFTYNMIHLESYSQNCAALPSRTHEDKRIYGKLENLSGEDQWSKRQIRFFRDNRD